MDLQAFLFLHGLKAETIDGPACLKQLLRQMELGLAGVGNIPMIPSYLSLDIHPEAEIPCCVIDAGGTNLRIARAEFLANGSCELSDITKTAMPGTRGSLSAEEFYRILANYAHSTGCPDRIGLCFSFNVLQERNLDGVLQAWCKEIRIPDAPGKPVGASLQKALGPVCSSVRVLNDSTAALLGAHTQDPGITLGLILGTGINVCYPEDCCNIPKVPSDLQQDTMIISTEIGEFDGFPKSSFEEAVIAATDEPDLAHAEKQCAGAYLGQVISLAWQEAVREGLLPDVFSQEYTLPQISDYLAGCFALLPENSAATVLAQAIIHRAAKMAAVLTAGPVLRSNPKEKRCSIAIEGSQFYRLTGFGDRFLEELTSLLAPYGIHFSIASVENSCLLGAALAAFAEPM